MITNREAPDAAEGAERPAQGTHPQRRVLIVGSGGSIGRALALAFARIGDEVAAVSRNGEGLEELRLRLAELPGAVPHSFCRADLETDDGRSQLQSLVGEYPPDIVVLNLHARRPMLRLEKLASGALSQAVEANLGYLPMILPAALAHQRSLGWGRWIAISSEIAHIGGPGQALYAVHKAALEALLRTLAIEEGPEGITANSIAAGYVATEAARSVHPPRVEALMQKAGATKQLGTPMDIVRAALYLSEAGSVTGQTLHVGGGLDLGWWMVKGALL